jgi:carbamoyl-phosphate synthase small subunit
LSAIAGIDTRRLTRILRDGGALTGAFGTANESDLLAAARAEPGTDGVDLVAQVSTDHAYTVGSGERRIVAYDFGIKYSIVDYLATLGTVTVVPAATSAEEVMALAPSGVFLSNGPGDPASVGYAVDAIRDLVGRVPIFGICLGHQLLSRALGGETFKLPFGHHGGNHPVRHLGSGKVEITSQNHNFCVDPESLGDRVEITHINLNDNTNEGMMVKGQPAFSVQYHPEAGPGPHDASYLFGMFEDMINDPQHWRDRPTARRTPAPRVAGTPAAELGVA